ncbi:MAG TPA: DUF2461 domain-containing protein [Bacteroidales bacterium]|nr:DUF2461 domain-containing protein [Bacteroidales bacterium]
MIRIEQNTVDFLKELAQNNNRVWFNQNKERYLLAKQNFDEFVRNLLDYLSSIDSSLASLDVKDTVYRIYRDIRFSKNKTPYKTHFGAYIVKNGRRTSPFAGYYLHLGVYDSFFGGGLYNPQPEHLKMLRKEIYYQIDEFKGILNNPGFKKFYDGIEPIEVLKNPPLGFPKDFPDVDLLKHKHYCASTIYTLDDALKPDFADYLYEGMKEVKPLVDFINFTIENDTGEWNFDF